MSTYSDAARVVAGIVGEMPTMSDNVGGCMMLEVQLEGAWLWISDVYGDCLRANPSDNEGWGVGVYPGNLQDLPAGTSQSVVDVSIEYDTSLEALRHLTRGFT